MRCISAIMAIFYATIPALAADPKAKVFGDWTAYCLKQTGCALATAAADGHRLAFSEPDRGEDRMVFLPIEPIEPGSQVTLTLDGTAGAVLGPEKGWHVVTMPGGSAVQIAPDIAENEMMQRMPTRTQIEIYYRGISGKAHKATLSLMGYSRARAYVTSNQ